MKQERNTKQKKIILDELIAAGHPTATELYERVYAINPKISRATVFRVLSQFAEGGAVRKISITGSDARFDATTVPHGHMMCLNCGTVKDVFLDDFKKALCVEELNGFKVYTADLNYVGVCKNCLQNEKSI